MSDGVRVLVDQAVEDRFSADPLRVDVGHGGAGSVTVAVGDALYPQGPQRVTAEGLSLVNGETTTAGGFLVRSACVSVGDGELTLGVGGLAGNTALDWVRVTSESCR